jgi:Fe-S cluster assembly ATPase SufC
VSELFRIENLHARPVTDDGESADDILRGLSLKVAAGEVHAIMGPNGCGKSTLASTLLASPEYEVTSGDIFLNDENITDWTTDVRAKAGMFLAFQYPQEIAGVSVIQFLRQALSARKGIDLSVLELRLSAMDWICLNQSSQFLTKQTPVSTSMHCASLRKVSVKCESIVRISAFFSSRTTNVFLTSYSQTTCTS